QAQIFVVQQVQQYDAVAELTGTDMRGEVEAGHGCRFGPWSAAAKPQTGRLERRQADQIGAYAFVFSGKVGASGLAPWVLSRVCTFADPRLIIMAVISIPYC